MSSLQNSTDPFARSLQKCARSLHLITFNNVNNLINIANFTVLRILRIYPCLTVLTVFLIKSQKQSFNRTKRFFPCLFLQMDNNKNGMPAKSFLFTQDKIHLQRK